MDLKLGEVVCDECKGTGYDLEIPKQKNSNPYYMKHYNCPKCFGLGKLDWVENIVGKRKSNLNMSGVPPSDAKPQNINTNNNYVDSNANDVYIYDGTVWVHAVSQSIPI